MQGDYSPDRVAVGDLNGDGKFDFVLKQPGGRVDPGVWRKSPETFKVEAYLNDGTFLWRKDLGWNIELGIWYSPMIVYDFDGDGKAEVALKTAPLEPDFRDEDGRVEHTLAEPAQDPTDPGTDRLSLPAEERPLVEALEMDLLRGAVDNATVFHGLI